MAVGPVHAGIIEPGHFRFQCHGEKVFHLEISLGYQHRGVERALAAGRTSGRFITWRRWPATRPIGHATAYCQAVEALAGRRVPARAQVLRGDRAGTGAAGQPHRRPGRAGRRRGLSADGVVLRADSRRLSEHDRAALRQPVRPRTGPARRRGVRSRRGARRRSSRERLAAALARCDRGRRICCGTRRRSWRASRRPATVSRETCAALGLVGPAARACGAGARRAPANFPPASTASRTFRSRPGTPATCSPGRTCAGWRSSARWPSSPSSCRRCPKAGLASRRRPLAPAQMVVSLVEGWRGEICHVAMTDDAGRLRALQGRRSVVPQLDRPGDGAARTSRFPISRCATRASTCRTAGTICEAIGHE